MGIIERIRKAPARREAPAPDPPHAVMRVDYAELRERCRARREHSTDVAVVDEDPRLLYLLPNGARNIYFLPYLLIGEMIEDERQERLWFRSGSGIQFQDEFDLQDYIGRFNEKLGQQKRALAKRTFYTELTLETPDFDFEQSHFPFRFDGHHANKDLAYLVRTFHFVWEHNLREFRLRFDVPFETPARAKAWKRAGNFLRLGLLFEVLCYVSRLWTNGMPATVCYVHGLQLIDGLRSEVIEEPAWELRAIRGERAGRMDADAIRARVQKLTGTGWKGI